jgi:hypothetical protein
MLKISPDAARRPLYGSPYQLASPFSVAPMRAGLGGATGARDCLCFAQLLNITHDAVSSNARRVNGRDEVFNSTKTILLDYVFAF